MTLVEKFLHKKKTCYSPKQIRFMCWWTWGGGGYSKKQVMWHTRCCLRINERITSTVGSKIEGYFQGMSVTIATCSLKTTSSGAGYVPGLVHFRDIGAYVIYWRASVGVNIYKNIQVAYISKHLNIMKKVNIFFHSFQKVKPIYYMHSLHIEWNISSLYFLKFVWLGLTDNENPKVSQKLKQLNN